MKNKINFTLLITTIFLFTINILYSAPILRGIFLNLNTNQSNSSFNYAAEKQITLTPGFHFNAMANSQVFHGYIADYPFDSEIVYLKPYDPTTPDEPMMEQPCDQRDLTKFPVGSINGNLVVLPSGAASYTIPINVSPGTNGVQPNISLTYSSGTRAGIAGYGWNLSGISNISRAPRIKYYDGEDQKINYDKNDRLTLDGTHLLPVEHNWGDPDAVFAPESNDDLRVFPKDDYNYFIVETAGGGIAEYGRTADSKMLGENGAVIAFFLNRTIDLNGNYIDYKYEQGYNEFWLTEIDYTGNINNLEPYSKILFKYDTKRDFNTVFDNNNKMQQSLLLKSVEVFCNNQLYKKYELEYISKDVSFLHRIKEYTLSEAVRYNATVFKYDNEVYGPANNEDLVLNSTPLGTHNFPPEDQYTNFEYVFGDFDGDGIQDRYVVEADYDSGPINDVMKFRFQKGKYVDYGAATATITYEPSATNSDYDFEVAPEARLNLTNWSDYQTCNNWKGLPKNTIVADFNNDGRVELLVCQGYDVNLGTNLVNDDLNLSKDDTRGAEFRKKRPDLREVLLYTLYEFKNNKIVKTNLRFPIRYYGKNGGNSYWWYRTYVPHLVHQNNNVYPKLVFTCQKYYDWFQAIWKSPVDWRRLDILEYDITDASGNWVNSSTYTDCLNGENITRSFTKDNAQVYFSDFDGDKNDEMLVLADHSTEENGFYKSCWNKIPNLTANLNRNEEYLTGDFNGDGKLDFLKRDNKGELAIAYWVGSQFSSFTNIGINSPLHFDVNGEVQTIKVADFNGDGLSDIYIYQNTYNQWLSFNPAGNLIPKPPSEYYVYHDLYLSVGSQSNFSSKFNKKSLHQSMLTNDPITLPMLTNDNVYLLSLNGKTTPQLCVIDSKNDGNGLVLSFFDPRNDYRLAQITDGLNNTQTIFYNDIQASGKNDISIVGNPLFYTPSNQYSSDPNVVHINSGFKVVTAIQNTTCGNLNEITGTTYCYGGLISHKYVRGILGFLSFTTEVPDDKGTSISTNSSILDQTYYILVNDKKEVSRKNLLGASTPIGSTRFKYDIRPIASSDPIYKRYKMLPIDIGVSDLLNKTTTNTHNEYGRNNEVKTSETKIYPFASATFGASGEEKSSVSEYEFESSKPFLWCTQSMPQTITSTITKPGDSRKITENYDYYTNNRLKSKVTQNGSVPEIVTSTTTYETYNKFGEPTTIIGMPMTGHSNKNEVEYDDQGRFIIKQSGYKNSDLINHESYNFGNFGELRQKYNALGLCTTYNYDGMLRLIETMDPLKNVSSSTLEWYNSSDPYLPGMSSIVYKSSEYVNSRLGEVGNPKYTYFNFRMQPLYSIVIDKSTPTDNRIKTIKNFNKYGHLLTEELSDLSVGVLNTTKIKYNDLYLQDEVTNIARGSTTTTSFKYNIDPGYGYRSVEAEEVIADPVKTITRSNIAYKNTSNELVKIIDPSGNELTMDYNIDGNLLTSNTVVGNTPNILVEKRTYTDYGALKTITDNDQAVLTMTYAPAGVLESVERASLGTIRYNYNSFDQIKSKEYQIASQPTKTETYNYDDVINSGHVFKNRKLKEIVFDDKPGDQGNKYSFEYDDYLRLQKTTCTLNSLKENPWTNRPKVNEFSVAYNPIGQVSNVVLPNIGCNLIYNQNQFLQSIDDLWVLEKRDATGEKVVAGLSPKFDCEVDYNTSDGTLKAIKTTAAQIPNYTYQVNPGTQNVESRSDGSVNTESFEYDNQMDRLTNIKNTKESVDITMNYNHDGGIQSKTDVGNYKYTDANGAISAPNHGVKAIENPTPIFLRALKTHNVEYNGFAKVSKITTTDNNNDKYVTEFTYGPNQERVATYTTKNGQPYKNKFFLNNYEVIDQYTDANHYKRKEISYLNADNGIFAANIKSKKVKIIEGVEYDEEEGLYFLHFDHLGSLIGITKENGDFYGAFSYDAWGRLRRPVKWANDDDAPWLELAQGEDVAGQFALLERGFCFHEHLPEHGVINMNGRLYDPLTGQFLQADNVVPDQNNTQCYNKFAYVNNNPLKYTDPSGHIPLWVIPAAIFAITEGPVLYATFQNSGSEGWNATGMAVVNLGLSYLGGYIGGELGCSLQQYNGLSPALANLISGSVIQGLHSAMNGTSFFSPEFLLSSALQAATGSWKSPHSNDLAYSPQSTDQAPLTLYDIPTTVIIAAKIPYAPSPEALASSRNFSNTQAAINAAKNGHPVFGFKDQKNATTNPGMSNGSSLWQNGNAQYLLFSLYTQYQIGLNMDYHYETKDMDWSWASQRGLNVSYNEQTMKLSNLPMGKLGILDLTPTGYNPYFFAFGHIGITKIGETTFQLSQDQFDFDYQSEGSMKRNIITGVGSLFVFGRPFDVPIFPVPAALFGGPFAIVFHGTINIGK